MVKVRSSGGDIVVTVPADRLIDDPEARRDNQAKVRLTPDELTRIIKSPETADTINQANREGRENRLKRIEQLRAEIKRLEDQDKPINPGPAIRGKSPVDW
jgi:hypothetical protein